MEILNINNESIRKAILILKHGGSVVFPTETAYGLAADATNKKAIQKIFKIKQRPIEKSLPWIVASVAMAKKYAKFSKLALKLAKKYWPGPLTMVLPLKERASLRGSAKSGNKTLALRVSSNKIARELSAGLGMPIISTSANISGRLSCYSVMAVVKQFKNKKFQPDLILDAGRLPKRKPSTIIKIENNQAVVFRQGNIRPS